MGCGENFMFFIKKAVTPFLVPPGIFIILLIISGIAFFFKRSRKAGLVQLLIGVSMWIFALGSISNALYKGLESEFSVNRAVKGDVIILMGGGINDEATDLSGVGTPSQESLERIVAAVRLQRRLNVPVIATGGGFAHQKISEAAVAKRYLVELGVPSQMVILEEKSRDTIESAGFTREICRKSGFHSPVLVTSGYHLRRAVMSFKKVGIKVIPFPSGIKSTEKTKFVWVDVLPTDYQNISRALKEYLGFLFYQIIY